MLNFEEEGKMSTVPGLALAPMSSFMPSGAPGAAAPQALDERFSAGNAFRRIKVEDKISRPMAKVASHV